MPQLTPKYVSDDEILEFLKEFPATIDNAIEQGLTKSGVSMSLANEILKKTPDVTQMSVAKHILRRLTALKKGDEDETESVTNYPVNELVLEKFTASRIIGENGKFKNDLGDLLQDILGKLLNYFFSFLTLLFSKLPWNFRFNGEIIPYFG